MTDMKTILPILNSFGISPETLGPDKMKLICELAETISNPETMTSEESTKILRELGLGIKSNRLKKSEPKTQRNARCPCDSGNKYKFCCLSKK